VKDYLRNIFRALATIVTGLRITLKYYFAQPITVQYPEIAPVLQPRYRGIHVFEIEKCIACDLCAKACPVDCIYIEKSGPRKIDPASGIARGGAVERFAIDYAKCMFCALCIEPCPTDCIHMGNLHDMSAYDRGAMIVEFTALAAEGLQTPQPLWMQREDAAPWAQQRRQEWIDRGSANADEMRKSLIETAIPPPVRKKAADSAGP
jgi:NADH-quinone oxidoreductase subunit I